MTRILILGGGFAGVQTALELERQLAHEKDVDITLVSRDNFLLFTPMLHEVAASDLDITAIVNPIRKMLRRTHFIAADVQAVDLEQRRVEVVHGGAAHGHVLPYDHLVLALGSVTNFHGIEGLQERALTIKSLEDAIHLRNRMIAHLEEADPDCNAHPKRAVLTLVVAGGGFAGVETVGGMYDFMHAALRSYKNLRADMLRIVLVHSGKYLLPELGEELGRYTRDKLAARGIEIRTGVRVSSISDEGVLLSDGTFIETMFVVWTAGTSPSPLVANLPCADAHGRVMVNRCLAVPEWPGVWGLGDCASIPDESGSFYPPTAQHAIREAKVLGANIAAAIQGRPAREFSFKTLGQLAAIGQRVGVAKVLGLQFSGFLAWWMWRTIYLAKLPRWEKRLHVALDWTLDVFFSKDLVQYISFRAPGRGKIEIPVAVSVDSVDMS